jgi:single-strand DNA-binding protein
MFNSVFLTGRLVRDPESRIASGNISICNITIAVDRAFVSSNGERGTDFIRCTAFRQTADNIVKFFKKGSLIGIEGSIQTSSSTNADGTTRYNTDIIISQFHFLERKNSDENQARSNTNYQSNNNYQNSNNNTNSYEAPRAAEIDDDDLPF